MVQADVGIDSTQVIAGDSTADIKVEESLILRQKLVDQALELERLRYQINLLLLESTLYERAGDRIKRKADKWDYAVLGFYGAIFITGMVLAACGK